MNLKTTSLTLTYLVATPMAQAATFAFGPTGASSVSIPGTDDGTGNPITYSSTLINGGTATPGNHNASSGTVNSVVGGTYDGIYFDPTVDGNNSLTTVIGSGRRENIDSGETSQYANFLGISVSFSAPIEMFAFGFLDLDGSTPEQNEWTGSFGYNSVTTATVTPTIRLGSLADQGQSSETVNWSGLTGAPTVADIVFNNNATAGQDPDDPATQVTFDYGGALITNLHFVWGLQGDHTGNVNAVNNSGVTGFIVLEENVPEPSSTFLLGLGALGLLGRRKRS